MKLLSDVGFVWEVERGCSIAQLQRVAVVGLPDRKGGNLKKASSSDVAKTEATATTTAAPPADDAGRLVASIPQHLDVPQLSTLRGRNAPSDDREARDKTAETAWHNLLAHQANPLVNAARPQSQLQQLLDSEDVRARSRLHNVNPAISNATTANPSLLVAALRQQQQQLAALPIHTLMPAAHHLSILGLGPAGAQSTLSLATLRALHGQGPSNHGLAAMLGCTTSIGSSPHHVLPSALIGDFDSAQIRAFVNSGLASPTSASSRALSAALGGPEHMQTAPLFLPSAAPRLPSSLGASSNLGGLLRQSISEASRLHLANLMTGASRRSFGATAAADLLWNPTPPSADAYATALAEMRPNSSACMGLPQHLLESARRNYTAVWNVGSDAPGLVPGVPQSSTQQESASATHLAASARGVLQQQPSIQASSEDTSDAEGSE
jgi:hypothetical protein